VFDWLCDATSLAALARRSWAGRDPVVLDMGCGNSELPEALARGDRSDVGGWQRAGFVLGSDYSSSGVLQLMASRAAAGGLGGYIDYMIDDVRALPLRSATVDVVIDKGCLDSVLQDADQIRLSMRWQRHTSRDAGPLRTKPGVPLWNPYQLNVESRTCCLGLTVKQACVSCSLR